MTPEQQRIAIAEACGWKHEWLHGGEHPCMDGGLMDGDSMVFKSPNGGYVGNIDDVPNYLFDLNAMHEAEMTLTARQKSEFICWIWNHSECNWDAFHFTAAQRAEAFLRTIGKWE